MEKVRIATIQLKGETIHSIEDYKEFLSEQIKKANQPDVIMLPEYAMLPLLQKYTDVSISEIGNLFDKDFTDMVPEMTEMFAQIARDYMVHILIGSHWNLIDGKAYNEAFFFYPDGSHQKFAKCYPTPAEEAMHMYQGQTPGLIKLSDDVKLGILICFDSEFPELARELVSQGAQVLLIPSLTMNERGAWRVELCARARAVENQVYVVTSTNQVTLNIPKERALSGVGRSGIYGPIDNKTRLVDGVIVATDSLGDQLLVADLNLTVLKASQYNSEAPLRKHLDIRLKEEVK